MKASWSFPTTAHILDITSRIRYAYVQAYWPRMGELDVTHFFIPYDSRANFHGNNSMDAVAERAGQGEMHMELVNRLMKTLVNWETEEMEFHPDLSYMGPPSGSQ